MADREQGMSKRDIEEFFPDDDQVRADSAHGDPERQPEVGRIVEPEAGLGALDKTAEAVATDVGDDDSDLSAEEAGMHIETEPPGSGA